MKYKKIALYKNKKKIVLDIYECDPIEKILGLMIFKNKALLLFNSNKKRKTKIHSFFCKPFLAIYTNDENKIQEIKKINSWKLSISPKNKFNKLIEIPTNKKYSHIIKLLVDDTKDLKRVSPTNSKLRD
jgi:uncharacterized membrane protein (UPF0127 family)